MISAQSTLPRLRCVCGSNWRMDSISSPKNSSRVGSIRIGREHVEDAAAPAELARQFNDFTASILMINQPTSQSIQASRFTYP